jgi:hypothetical protein
LLGEQTDLRTTLNNPELSRRNLRRSEIAYGEESQLYIGYFENDHGE